MNKDKHDNDRRKPVPPDESIGHGYFKDDDDFESYESFEDFNDGFDSKKRDLDSSAGYKDEERYGDSSSGARHRDVYGEDRYRDEPRPSSSRDYRDERSKDAPPRKPSSETKKWDPMYDAYVDDKKVSEERNYEDSERYEKGTSPELKETKPPKKPQYMTFIVLIVFIGIVVTILAMAIGFKAVSSKRPKNDLINTTPTEETEAIVESGKELSLIGVVIDISTSKEVVEVYDFEEGKTHMLKKDDLSEFKDKYGQNLIFAEIEKGDVATISYYENSEFVKLLKLNADAWDNKQVKGVKVNASNKSLSVNNDTYTYDSRLISLYQGKHYDISSLTENDVVNMKGYRQKLLYIELAQGHGGISVINNDKIKDGTIEIGNTVFNPLGSGENTFDLPEGSHKVVVKGSNIETYVVDVNVREGSTEIVDLSKVFFKSGALSVNVNVSDYSLTIDGESRSTGEPIMLEYGKHKILVEKAEYKSQEKEVVIDKEQVSLSFELEEDIKLARITITTEPNDTEIHIDGTYIGQSPQTVDIVYGYHTLIAKKDGYIEVNSPLTIEEGGKTTYNIMLSATSPLPDTNDFTFDENGQ